MPEQVDAAEPLGQAVQALAAMDPLQFIEEHGHANRADPQGPAQVRLGAAAVAQPVLEKALEILQLFEAEAGHQRTGGNHWSSLRWARLRTASLMWLR